MRDRVSERTRETARVCFRCRARETINSMRGCTRKLDGTVQAKTQGVRAKMDEYGDSAKTVIQTYDQMVEKERQGGGEEGLGAVALLCVRMDKRMESNRWTSSVKKHRILGWNSAVKRIVDSGFLAGAVHQDFAWVCELGGIEAWQG